MFGKHPKPSTYLIPAPVETLPLDSLRARMLTRDSAVRMSAQQGPSAPVEAWLPQRFLLANRWKIGETSSSVTSPIAAVRQSGSTTRVLSSRTPIAHQPIAQVAQQKSAAMLSQMRAPSGGNITQPQAVNEIARSVPPLGDRISPHALSQSVNRSIAARQVAGEGRGAAMGKAVTDALQQREFGAANIITRKR